MSFLEKLGKKLNIRPREKTKAEVIEQLKTKLADKKKALREKESLLADLESFPADLERDPSRPDQIQSAQETAAKIRKDIEALNENLHSLENF